MTQEVTRCPMCGSPVVVAGDDEEGTHYYVSAVERALDGIATAAIEHGVNDEVAAAIAHAGVILRSWRA